MTVLYLYSFNTLIPNFPEMLVAIKEFFRNLNVNLILQDLKLNITGDLNKWKQRLYLAIKLYKWAV